MICVGRCTLGTVLRERFTPWFRVGAAGHRHAVEAQKVAARMLSRIGLGLTLVTSSLVALRADERIDRYVEAEMTLNRMPGLALAIVEGGGVTYVRAYGVRSVQSQEPLRAEDPVELASVSKSFTALAVLELERAGRIDRGDAVSAALPELDSRAWRGVTLHHLLRHRSGLRRRHDFLAPCCAGPGAPDPEEAARHLAAPSLESPPGETFSYANSNYMLLAAVVQRVSGMPFAEFMRQAVFRPLGLRRTTVEAGEARRWGAASPHEWLWGRVRPSPSRFLGWPGSSLVKASARDMGNYMAALLEPAAVPAADRPWWEGLAPGYDLGWVVDAEANWLEGEFVLEHTGKIWGGQTAVVLAPLRRTGVAVLINLGTGRAIEMARQILASRIASTELSPAQTSPLERPDNWAMAFLALAAGLLGAAVWHGRRAVRQLRAGLRSWGPAGPGMARAALLGGMAAVLVSSAFQWTGPPRAALPSTVRVALPALVAGAATLLAVVAGASLVPPKRSRKEFPSDRAGQAGR